MALDSVVLAPAGLPSGGYAGHWAGFHNIHDKLEVVLWLTLLVGLVAWIWSASRTWPRFPRPDWIDAGLLALGLGMRCLAPKLTSNWYSGVSNLPLGGAIYSKPTTWMPLLLRVVIFDSGGGFRAAVALNMAIGVVVPVILRRALLRAGFERRVAALVGVMMAAGWPYVRLSTSDATHHLPLLFWSLSVLALVALAKGKAGAGCQAVLFAATVLGCEPRLEAAAYMCGVPFLAGTTPAAWRSLWHDRSRTWPYLPGLILGIAWSIELHGFFVLPPASHGHGLALVGPLIMLVVGLIGRCTINPVGLIELFGVIAVWWYVIARYRAGDRSEVVAVVAPILLLSICPALFSKASFENLPNAAYHVLFLPFVFLAFAKALVFLWEKWKANGWRTWAWVLFVGILLTYPARAMTGIFHDRLLYEREFQFLQQSLPQGKGTVLALWDEGDPGNDRGDYDCCLALPYPTFVADFPGLDWIVIRSPDVDRAALKKIHFDYYYPGTLPLLAEQAQKNHGGGFRNDYPLNAGEPAGFLRLDQFIRRQFALDEIGHAEVPVQLFDGWTFGPDKLRLALYRHPG